MSDLFKNPDCHNGDILSLFGDVAGGAAQLPQAGAASAGNLGLGTDVIPMDFNWQEPRHAQSPHVQTSNPIAVVLGNAYVDAAGRQPTTVPTPQNPAGATPHIGLSEHHKAVGDRLSRAKGNERADLILRGPDFVLDYFNALKGFGELTHTPQMLTVGYILEERCNHHLHGNVNMATILVKAGQARELYPLLYALPDEKKKIVMEDGDTAVALLEKNCKLEAVLMLWPRGRDPIPLLDKMEQIYRSRLGSDQRGALDDVAKIATMMQAKEAFLTGYNLANCALVSINDHIDARQSQRGPGRAPI